MITDEEEPDRFGERGLHADHRLRPDEVIGQDPRMLASGRHDTSFYRQMWDALQRTAIGPAKSSTGARAAMSTEMDVDQCRHGVPRRTGNALHRDVLDITERKRAEERIHFLAHHDALTELPNRLSLELRLEQALIDARRHDWNVGVLFIDLDRFKVINDTLGHNIGDKLLIEVARRFTVAVRESDMVARLGGDEFVIVLPTSRIPMPQHTLR